MALVSIQQASVNALALWLGSVMPDVQVLGHWPNGAILPPKAISIVTAGQRRDTPLDSLIYASTPSGATNAVVQFQVAACYQPVQLDVWTTNYAVRDDIMARLDIFLRADASALVGAYNAPPVGNGVLVAVADGWLNTIADFVFQSADTDETGDAVQASQFRATYAGGAHVKLTVTKTTARQKLIQFQLRLNGEANPTNTQVR